MASVRDGALRHTLAFGVGIHHAGLCEGDRSLCERLFVEGAILVLVCTATLAWGVNFPAHLVVVKGTEYFDGKQQRYVDMPVTDVLQMMGRAGRPQYDDRGVAVILVHEPKKQFYRKFLYEPFPVESCLHGALHDHLNAEVAAGTVASRQDALDWLTWTFLYRRLRRNPAYYGLEGDSGEERSAWMSELVEGALQDLRAAGCVELQADGLGVAPLPLGQVASAYYLSHATVATFHAALGEGRRLRGGLGGLLGLLCDAAEFAELPVRHNEGELNAELAALCPLPVDEGALDAPHVKANLLLQAHVSRAALPSSDYATDTRGALDQALRVLQAMVDIAADAGSLPNALGAMALCQSLCQAAWPSGQQLQTLPHVSAKAAAAVAAQGRGRSSHLAQLAEMSDGEVRRLFGGHLDARQLAELLRALRSFPLVDVRPQLPEPPAGGARALLLRADEDATLVVHLARANRPTGRAAYAPRLPKPKSEGWWLVLAEGDELLALKRLTLGREARVELRLVAPAQIGETVFSLHLVSDVYLGFDQQVDMRVLVS